jgi:hypothetical protein
MHLKSSTETVAERTLLATSAPRQFQLRVRRIDDGGDT